MNFDVILKYKVMVESSKNQFPLTKRNSVVEDQGSLVKYKDKRTMLQTSSCCIGQTNLSQQITRIAGPDKNMRNI